MRIDVLWSRYMSGSSEERRALEREVASEYGENFAGLLMDAFGSAECEKMLEDTLAVVRRK